MKPPVPRVHAVTDRDVAALPNLSSVASTLALSPRIAFHARHSGVDGARLLDLAYALRAAAGPKSPLFVNDRIDVAWLVRAAGVHLPENGIPLSAARALLTADQLLGRSVHHPDDARRAVDEGADYVFLGPIWQSASHPDRAALGTGALRGLGPFPVIAIGGITPERARACRDAGAWGVAAISALWRSSEPAASARAMLLSFDEE